LGRARVERHLLAVLGEECVEGGEGRPGADGHRHVGGLVLDHAVGCSHFRGTERWRTADTPMRARTDGHEYRCAQIHVPSGTRSRLSNTGSGCGLPSPAWKTFITMSSCCAAIA